MICPECKSDVRMLVYDSRGTRCRQCSNPNSVRMLATRDDFMLPGDMQLAYGPSARPPTPIPWQPFVSVEHHRLTPADVCLWWMEIRGEIQVFVGRVAYWPATDSAAVRRQSGSIVLAGPGSFFAVITPPVPCAPLPS